MSEAKSLVLSVREKLPPTPDPSQGGLREPHVLKPECRLGHKGSD